MGTALIVVAGLATAVVVDVISGLLIRRAARGRYKWLLEPLRHACRRPAAAVLLVGALYYAVRTGRVAALSTAHRPADPDRPQLVTGDQGIERC